MKALILAFAITVGLPAPAAAASWGHPGLAVDMQAQKPRQGRDQGEPQRGRDARAERQGSSDQRREQLNDDERRALHRDLDKANRELYRRR